MKVNELFTSIQGEGSRTGLPCTFVRFTACDLRCTYCDTEYSFFGGTRWDIGDLLADVKKRGVHLVCVTGGEPMLQKKIVEFLERLLAQGHEVLLETGGHRYLGETPRDIVRIVDVKTPGAFRKDAGIEYARGEKFRAAHFNYRNLDVLAPHDEVKFVVTSRFDYEWARDFAREHRLAERVAQVNVSPSFQDVASSDLAAWMLEDRWNARLNLQIHKVIWDPEARAV